MFGKIHIAIVSVGVAMFFAPQLSYAGANSPLISGYHPQTAAWDIYRKFRHEHHAHHDHDHDHGHGHGHHCDDHHLFHWFHGHHDDCVEVSRH